MGCRADVEVKARTASARGEIRRRRLLPDRPPHAPPCADLHQPSFPNAKMTTTRFELVPLAGPHLEGGALDHSATLSRRAGSRLSQGERRAGA